MYIRCLINWLIIYYTNAFLPGAICQIYPLKPRQVQLDVRSHLKKHQFIPPPQSLISILQYFRKNHRSDEVSSNLTRFRASVDFCNLFLRKLNNVFFSFYAIDVYVASVVFRNKRRNISPIARISCFKHPVYAF